MNPIEALSPTAPELLQHRPAPRFVTAAALYDGHDAAINLVRRGLVSAGAEVVHLGHNRSAGEIVKAAVEEDAAGVAVSSYQGGHEDFYPYLRKLLDEEGAREVAIFAGGGGVILPDEVATLESSGITKVFTPDDGFRLGIDGMMRFMVEAARGASAAAGRADAATATERLAIARAITAVELGGQPSSAFRGLRSASRADESASTIVLGITGTGGAGKSSLVDELVLRLVRDAPDLRVGIVAVDPTKRRTGGALLGDRLRMNAVYKPQVFLRSLATRSSGTELSAAVEGAVGVMRLAGYDLVIVETAGIGQGSSAITDLADVSLYVMTPDFGGPTQLEKIDMLDFADLVAVNKCDRRGGEDTVRLVRRQVARSRKDAGVAVEGTQASRFNDPGVNALYRELLRRLGEHLPALRGVQIPDARSAPAVRPIPPSRENYLAEAADAVRGYRLRAREEVERMRTLEGLETAAAYLDRSAPRTAESAVNDLRTAIEHEASRLVQARKDLSEFETLARELDSPGAVYAVRGQSITVETRRKSLSGLSIPRVALPRFGSRAETLRFLREENLPGKFPFTAGVFPFKRADELPTRQFAGEGTPERTNRRYHLLCDGLPAKRLSVAFDSVTLYGSDPHERPDIYGKIGTSGVSIATLDDMKKLFRGFDLLDPSTSVSMTINGPAAVILAMFFGAAIAQEEERFSTQAGRPPSAEEGRKLRAKVLENVRGTVQADILKEDQAQNTCLLSTDFSLKLMGDVQEFFIANKVKNFYSVSISGYHIAEAGANPITQLAFTLANGLTYLEYYKARGMNVDDFAPNFSFFFSNGLEPEYSVLGRVARRIWAIILHDVHGANERSQKLKYHVQTSGRSLHAREIAFNDVRTTLQALLAVYDNCNSLHTNAYDEAITTPTEESVRRALAIQLIVQKELGMTKNENPLQGAFIIRELTDLVEEAVLSEFLRLSERGGVPGAMETAYMRSRIQEESLLYEELKHSGTLPIIGVNTFLAPEEPEKTARRIPVVRSTDAEKREQIHNLREFQARHRDAAPAALTQLREAALRGDNLFASLLGSVQHASLGQITEALFEVGGQYRRSL